MPDIAMPSARPRRSAGNAAASSASPAVHDIAPAAPCTARAANSIGSLLAVANSNRLDNRPHAPSRSVRPAPRRSHNRPANGIVIRRTTAYAPKRNPSSRSPTPQGRAKSCMNGTTMSYTARSVNSVSVTRASAQKDRRIVVPPIRLDRSRHRGFPQRRPRADEAHQVGQVLGGRPQRRHRVPEIRPQPRVVVDDVHVEERQVMAERPKDPLLQRRADVLAEVIAA